MPIKAIIFDFDGTVVDSGVLITESFRHTVRTVLGLDLPDEELTRNVGQPLRAQMSYFAPGREEELMKVYREHNHAMHDSMIKRFPEVEIVLEELRGKGFRLALVTSKGRLLTDRGIELFKLGHLFETVITADDVRDHKPHPGPVLEALKRMGVPANEAIFIGDAPADIRSGKAAGVKTVAVLWGMFSREMLEKEKPDFLIKAPSELIKLIL